MQALFSPDSKFLQAMSRIGDLLVLNLLFLLTCIPVFTIGAAATALYTVCFRFDTDREKGLIRSYFAAFRGNLKQATLLWLLMLLCGGTACFNMFLFYGMSGPVHYGFVLFAVLLALVLLIGGLAFPLLSQFDNDNRSMLKNALILSLGYLPRAAAVAALNIFLFILMFVDFYLFLQTAFIWAALYFSAAAYLNTILLKKVFAPYMAPDEATEQV